jgi:hypothetical protein
MRRIVWHVNLMPQRGASRLVVNVFNARVPYASEQDVIANGAAEGALTDVIGSLSRRLLADIAAHPDADTPSTLDGVRQHRATSMLPPRQGVPT